jgi:hypothetical protein
MGQKASKSAPIYMTHADYTGAGILFSEGPLALAGVQKERMLGLNDTSTLSGFGGRREPDDIDWCHTAWREVIEELYNETVLPPTLIMTLRVKIPLRHDPTYSNGYVMFCLTFGDLELAMRICAKPKYKMHSNLYRTMPLTLQELLMNRLPISNTEIGSLALIPIIRPVKIAQEFLQDLSA